MEGNDDIQDSDSDDNELEGDDETRNDSDSNTESESDTDAEDDIWPDFPLDLNEAVKVDFHGKQLNMYFYASLIINWSGLLELDENLKLTDYENIKKYMEEYDIWPQEILRDACRQAPSLSTLVSVFNTRYQSTKGAMLIRERHMLKEPGVRGFLKENHNKFKLLWKGEKKSSFGLSDLTLFDNWDCNFDDTVDMDPKKHFESACIFNKFRRFNGSKLLSKKEFEKYLKKK